LPRRTHRIHRKSRNPRSDGRNDSTEPWRDSRCRWRDYPPGPMSQPPHGADKTNSRRAAGASTWDRCWYDRLFRERHNGIRPDIPASCILAIDRTLAHWVSPDATAVETHCVTRRAPLTVGYILPPTSAALSSAIMSISTHAPKYAMRAP
jgi:hypothetical protein